MITLDALRGASYGAILADPPWRFATWSDKGRGRCPDGMSSGQFRHYETMTLDAIKALPVADVAAQDCALFLWVTEPMLEHGLAVGKAWGFTYKTKAFCWAKRTKHGKWHIGTGHWTRANPEDCLLFTRGKPKRLSCAVRELIEAPVREHSRKPDEIYDRIEALVAGPYLELFARTRRDGWAQWGNQADKFSPASPPTPPKPTAAELSRRYLGADVKHIPPLPGQLDMLAADG
jgi:N6-adenosine-specific RNA methylase IME4